MTHLVCEWIVRLGAVGLVEDHACHVPMTQGELADALGVSTVPARLPARRLRCAWPLHD